MGRITVRTCLAGGLHNAEGPLKVEVYVEDTGCEIAEGDLTRLFEPGFIRTPGGSGIGLPLVREIVENQGRTDQGSRFIITLTL